eukprot:TRINITY_DN1965_c0_g1_i1.p1 TRINITY_DN1965_c0_g1~~TRINITY_DN1965_c0_g1_i1.p1  ORF type:complete len:254 (-),score=70.29 TRINITY_DN1965_c0_g1_i1:89-850(-)
MNKLNREQKEKVKNFESFTSANEKVAIEFLTLHKWNLELAVDGYFNSPVSAKAGASSAKVDNSKVEAFYSKYKEPDEDKIGENGLPRLFSDINVDLEDIVTLVLAWKLKAQALGEFSHSEFVTGMSELKIDSAEKLRERLPSLRAIISEDAAFREFYMFVFEYGKPPGQKSLPLEMAVELWQLVLKDKFRFLEPWVTYIKEKHKLAIPRDTWSLVLEFSRNINAQMSNYNPDDSWPVLIDEFVEYYREQNPAK